MRRMASAALMLALLTAAASCGAGNARTTTTGQALLLAYATFGKDDAGKPVPKPARLGILTQNGSTWDYRTLDDPDSNVFHKAMLYERSPGDQAVLTAGGTRAILKLWKKGAKPEVLWEASFGGKFSRMRDVEVGNLYGDGMPSLAVATHDQGVVATVRPKSDGGWEVKELDRQSDTIVHEIELGDLDGDGTLEIYATPSLPNKLDGTPQPGEVVRYVPARGQGRTVVAALGDRHAKEILCDDVDGDGRDELYVSVEAVAGGQVEIRRYDAGTPPDAGVLIATLADKLCRFLTAGDVDGDGKKEIVAAAHKSGLWLLRRGADPRGAWSTASIDRTSSGFEHAAILANLDGDSADELYVANDSAAEVNRYVWKDGSFQKTTLYKHPGGLSGFTWNLMPVPAAALP